jgi:Mannitol repressor
MPRKPIAEFDLNSFSGPFRSESDRACAVLGAALLDSRLECLYARRLRGFREELLAGNGPLSTFSARIRLARALAWIDEDVYFDLNQIRSIRNEFAHNADHQLSFTNSSIADRCRTLKVAQTLIDAHEHTATLGHRNFSAEAIRAMGAIFQPPRQRYEITVEMLAQHLDELSGESTGYSGPSLRDELSALGRADIKITAVGTVGAAPPGNRAE